MSDLFTPEEWQAIRLSLVVAAHAVAMGLPLAIIVSMLLRWPRMPGRTVLDIFAHLPLVLPPVVVGWLLLGEAVAALQVLGALIVVGAVMGLGLRRRRV